MPPLRQRAPEPAPASDADSLGGLLSWPAAVGRGGINGLMMVGPIANFLSKLYLIEPLDSA